MKKSKLIDLLKLLSKSEMRDFERFVESPFYNKDNKLVKLCALLKRYHPEFDSKKLDKVYVASKAFPEFKDDAARKVNYLMSGLTKLVEDFLVQQEMNEEQVDRDYYMLKSLQRRNADKYFFSLSEKVKQRLGQAKQWDMNFFYNQFRINHLAYVHPGTDRYQPHVDSLYECIDNLNLFYAATKLRYSSELLTRQHILAEKYNFLLLDRILEVIQEKPFNNYALFTIYKSIILLNEEPDQTVYLKLKGLIIENFEYFDQSEQLDLIIFLSNYIISHTRKGQHHAELFDIMKFSLKYDLWMNGGYFMSPAFLNIVNNGCALKEFEWTRNFIEQYGPKLKDDGSENSVFLASATLSFVEEKFDETLETLRYVDFTDINYSVFAKLLILQCYYEIPNYELAFFDFCNSFSQFLRRNKISSERNLVSSLNFITYTRKLFKHKIEGGASLEKIATEIQNIDDIANLSWLLEKLEELSN